MERTGSVCMEGVSNNNNNKKSSFFVSGVVPLAHALVVAPQKTSNLLMQMAM